uniref:Prolactin receptor n=1 Tax=Cyprinus carpio TaxID=7962 RepID=A0A8C1WG95_CYPCA
MFVSCEGKMWRDAEQALTLMWLLSWISHSMCHSSPGKPRITRCRSPEKETFTCWWEPGSTGGLPTSYQLYYRKESGMEMYKKNILIYLDHIQFISLFHFIYCCHLLVRYVCAVDYHLRRFIFFHTVQPHPPENVNVTFMQTTNSPYFLVQWQPPHDADTRSGWVTIKYEVRLKIENSGNEEDSNWESYSAGKQLEFSIYSPQPGANYIVQVRCKLDQGLWSEWSPSAFIQIPDNMSDTQNAFMIIAVTLMVIIFLLTAGVLTVKMKPVKHFFLPPVPEPKISGLDTQLLKSGKAEDIFSALITPGYPQIAQRSDHQVEYLVVSDYDEEMDFNGKAHLEFQKGENCLTDTLSATSGVLGEPQELLPLDCNGLPVKAQDQNTQMSSGSKCEHVSINPAGLMGYVEVDEEKRDQTPLVGEDYSMVTDVISDKILVLQDSIPKQGHKEVKWVRFPIKQQNLVLNYLNTKHKAIHN